MDAPVFAPVREISRRRWWRLTAAAFAVAAIALGFVPLLSTIGLEWSLAFAVPASLAAGFTGIAVEGAARGRRLEPIALWLAAFPVTLGPLIAPLAIGYLHGLHVRNCAPGQSALFWLLGPVGAALIASATGIALARVLPRPRRAGIALVVVIAVSLLRMGFAILADPAKFGASHFLGWVPGPIYDQAAGVSPALWYLRLLSLLFAALILLVSGFFGERLRGKLARAGALAATALALLVALLFRQDFKLDVTGSLIRDRALTATATTAHFDIYYAPAGDKQKAERLAADHEFRLAQVCAFFKVSPTRRLVSYDFPSEASKKEWTGAGATQVANPWKGEIYVDEQLGESSVIRHEIAHAVSGQFGGLFGISWTGLVPNIGFVEGLAVAADWHDNGEGNPHQRSAAMMAEGLLPDPQRFLGLGFWLDRQERSYTAAGSFIRFLADRYGIEKVRQAYAWSDFRGAFGKPLPALADEWRAFLTTLPVPPKRAAAAKSTFTRPSIFEKTCARELALIAERGDRAFQENRLDDAMRAYRAWEAVDDRASPLWRELWVWIERGDFARARALAATIADREVPDSPSWWNAKMNEADLDWREGNPAAARGEYAVIFEAHVSANLDRNAWIKRETAGAATSDDAGVRARAGVVRDWLLPPPRNRHDGLLANLTSAAHDARVARGARSEAFVTAYLLGRDLLASGAPDAALPWLSGCAAEVERGAAADSAAMRAEVFSMLARARTGAGDYAGAAAAWDRVRALPGVAEDVRDAAEDGALRTAWTADHDPFGFPRVVDATSHAP